MLHKTTSVITTILILAQRGLSFKGISPNIQNVEGESPLQISAACGFIDIVEILLRKGAFTDLPNNYGWTPLMHAARHGHAEVVSLLIHRKAKVNISNRLGLRPIDVATWNGNLECVNLLIEAGAVIDNFASSNAESDVCDLSALMAASLQGHNCAVRMLLDKGSFVNQASHITGLTSLMLAACKGYKNIIEILIEWRADVNKTDICGRTALDLAVVCGQKDTVTYLENVTLPNSKKCSGVVSQDTSIMHIIRSGDATRIKLLLQQNLNLCNYIDPTDGITPLMVACMLGYNNIVDLLIGNGADLNAQNASDGWTPLMYAVFHRQAETVHLLLDKGANVDICSSNGYTALDLATHIDSSETDIVETLMSHSGQEVLDTQDYLTCSTYSTIRRSHLTIEKTSTRSDSPARIKDWIGGLSSHLRQLSKSSTTSTTIDSQLFDETLSDVFIENNVTEKTLEGKYLSISKFYVPNQRFAHLLKDQEVEAINLPPLPSEKSCADLIKTISSRKDKSYRHKHVKPTFNSLRTPNLLKNYFRKYPPVYPLQVPEKKFSDSLHTQTLDFSAKSTMKSKVQNLLESGNSETTIRNTSESTTDESSFAQSQESEKYSRGTKNQKFCSESNSGSTIGAEVEDVENFGGLTALLSHKCLKKYAEKFRDQEIDLETFQYLTEDDLNEIGISSLKSRHKFMEIINKLKKT